MDPTSDPRRSFRHAPGLFDPEVLRRLRRYLDEIEPQRQAQAASPREAKAIARGESSDALRLDPRWFDAWRAPKAALFEAIGPYGWVVYPPQVRLVRALSHRVPWHQDAGYQRLLGPRAHLHHITCFVPIDDDPGNRTTLQFARLTLDELPHASRDGFGAGVAEIPESELVAFDLALGDGLVFGDLALHRTWVPPGACVERRSLEFRLVRPQDSIPDKDYFDVRAGEFVRRDGKARVAS
jgi:hypothetical protein